MSMENPQALFWLFLAIPLGIAFWFELGNIKAVTRQLGEHWTNDEVQSTIVFKWFLSLLCFIGFFVFGVLALAGIHWGEAPLEQDRQDSSVVFVIDVSRSMLAADVKPNRLGRALELVQGVAQDFPKLQAAIVAFKGHPVLVLPMTSDRIAWENALRYVTPQISSAAGSDPDAALAQAMRAFPAGSHRQRLIVFLGDGEGLTGQSVQLATAARKQGIPMVCVGLGLSAGSLVQLPDGSSLADAMGNPVLTRLEEGRLRSIAEASGGLYLAGSEANSLPSLIDGIRSLQQRTEQEGFQLVPVDRRSLFIALALTCLVGYVLVRAFRWRKLW